MLLWDIGVALSRSEGKPPPESFARIKKCGSFAHVAHMSNRKRTMLLTDGATCYPKMSKELNLLHQSVAHNRGQFTRTVYRGREKIVCHTGTIDAAWSALKDYIP